MFFWSCGIGKGWVGCHCGSSLIQLSPVFHNRIQHKLGLLHQNSLRFLGIPLPSFGCNVKIIPLRVVPFTLLIISSYSSLSLSNSNSFFLFLAFPLLLSTWSFSPFFFHFSHPPFLYFFFYVLFLKEDRIMTSEKWMVNEGQTYNAAKVLLMGNIKRCA